jgi:hypothetical protein
MKKSILILISIIFTSIAVNAKCAGTGIYLLSDRNELYKNGMIILEFYSGSQAVVKDLNTKYPIYLQSGKEKIMLVVTEILPGEFQVTQVMLKPAKEGKENSKYELKIDNLPDYAGTLKQFNTDLNKWEPPVFNVYNRVDTAAPVIDNIPIETNKVKEEFGCGPERLVYFKVQTNELSTLFVRVSVKNKTTNKVTDYILLVKDGQIVIGHGMCSGPFHFDGGKEFEVRFLFFDESGNKGNFTTPISFTAPV